MPAPKKVAQVELLTERFTDSSIVVGTGLTHMTASDMVELRLMPNPRAGTVVQPNDIPKP